MQKILNSIYNSWHNIGTLHIFDRTQSFEYVVSQDKNKDYYILHCHKNLWYTVWPRPQLQPKSRSKHNVEEPF